MQRKRRLSFHTMAAVRFLDDFIGSRNQTSRCWYSNLEPGANKKKTSEGRYNFLLKNWDKGEVFVLCV